MKRAREGQVSDKAPKRARYETDDSDSDSAASDAAPAPNDVVVITDSDAEAEAETVTETETETEAESTETETEAESTTESDTESSESSAEEVGAGALRAEERAAAVLDTDESNAEAEVLEDMEALEDLEEAGDAGAAAAPTAVRECIARLHEQFDARMQDQTNALMHLHACIKKMSEQVSVLEQAAAAERPFSSPRQLVPLLDISPHMRRFRSVSCPPTAHPEAARAESPVAEFEARAGRVCATSPIVDKIFS